MIASCAFGEVDLEGKQCPCSAGWVCDERDNVCVQSLEARDASAGLDAGRPPPREDASTIPDSGLDAGPLPFDGGPPDSGPPDAGPPTECEGALSGAIFCDGFEDGPGFDAWTSGGATTDGTLTWVEDVVYRGRGALRAETTVAGGTARLRTTTSPGVSSGDYWFRAYLRFPSEVILDHFDFGYSGPSTGGGVSYYIADDRPRLWLNETMTPVGTMALLPRDSWVCLQYHLTISDTEGALEIFVDGVLARSVDAIDTSPGAAYDRLGIGITYTDVSQPQPLVVYVDEIAVGTSPLPCD